jgi:pilus assembly protein Flp/PilA
MVKRLMSFVKDEDGVTMVEYALVLGLVAVAAILAWTNLGSKIGTTLTTATSKMP